ncbi:MAG TPA: hypothetical protein VGV67_11730 [Solirubrobacteraceae bacterium]|nr:hypothetical protein [Solirubrobacteraceae bacterium]
MGTERARATETEVSVAGVASAFVADLVALAGLERVQFALCSR